MGWAACFIVLCLLARWNRCSWLCRDSRKQKDKGWMLVWYRYSYLNGICFVAGTIKRSTHLNIRQHICWWLPFFLWPMHASVQHLFNLFTLYMECRHSWQTGETPRTTKKMRGVGEGSDTLRLYFSLHSRFLPPAYIWNCPNWDNKSLEERQKQR